LQKAASVAVGIFAHFDKYAAAVARAAAAAAKVGSDEGEQRHAEMPVNRVGLLL
jgi:hypothetical protein